MRQTGHSRWRQGAELKGVLDDLEKKVDAYEAKHPERKATTDALRAQIATERRLIDQVVAHGSGFRSQIAGQTISDETLYEASQTPTWANTTSLMAMKAAVGGRTTDQEVRLRGGQGFDSGAVNSVDLVRYQDGSTMVFKADKLMESSGTGAQLKETGIDLANPRTGARAVATHVVARHLGMENLVPRTEFAEHNGKIGTVSELAPGMALRSHHFRFVEPDASGRKIEDDEELERVQQLQQDNPDGFAQMGFVEEDDGSYRQLPPRSAKMDDVIVRVGGDVTDDDELAALNKLTENGDGESALRNLGIVAKDDGGYRRLDQVVTDPIEKAKLRAIPNDDLGAAGFARRESVYVRGRPADLRIDPQDPKMRRNLSNAQWLHASTHETDGHGGNMFADLDENGAVTGFKLIDPDQSFGPAGRGKDLPCFPGSSTRPVGNQADGLPVISKEFKRGLDNVDLAALRQDLQGLLSSDEIDATVDRIKNLKELAGQLEQQGKVLDSDDDWASDAAQPPQDKPRQYLNRLGPRAGDVPPLLAARALARLKAPEVQQ